MGSRGFAAARLARAPIALDYIMPAPDLARLVSSYYLFRVDLPRIEDVARAEMAQLRFLLTGGGRYRFGTGGYVDAPDVALTGPTHAATRIESRGPALVFGVGLRPAGWAALVCADAHRHRDKVVHASTLFGDIMPTMLASLRALPTLAEMAAFADVKIRQIAGRGKKPPFGFTDVVDAWLTADVSPDVDTLIAATGLSGRHVERLANRIYGAPPKLLARKFRALRAAARIAAGEDWQSLYDGPFYDQSHAIREFKRFIGLTPTQVLQSRSPIARMTFAHAAGSTRCRSSPA